MLSDDSDSLTDLSDEDKPQLARRTKKSNSGMAWRVRNALKPPRTTSYTARALYDQIHQGGINLSPEYQREVVWSDIKQINIIDSIFRNFYIPPIIFAVIPNDDGSDMKVCIDGKQRLTSIMKFMDGLIPHVDSDTGQKLWFQETTHRRAKDRLLPEQYVTVFQNKQITCVEYSDLTEENEREIFQRVQLGMALTTAEKQQGTIGPWASFIRQLVDNYASFDIIPLEMDRTRGREFQNVAQCVFTIERFPIQAGSGAQINKWLSQKDPPSSELLAKVHDTFRILKELSKSPSYSKALHGPKMPRVAPVEYIMITVLISQYKNRMSLAGLAEAIGTMRKDVRREHADIRTNGKVCKTLLEFIKRLKVPALQPGERVAGMPSKPSSSSSTKRKLDNIEDGELQEDERDVKPRI